MKDSEKIEEIYHAALEKTPNERDAFLREVCSENAELRREVESLLSFDEQAQSFIESPPDDLAAAVVSSQNGESLIGENINQYRIISLLGTGGMGKVYLAEDTKLHRRIALKILPAEFSRDDTRTARFLREAQAASALNHPNICIIHEIKDESDPPFIVMEHIEGETLGEKLKNHGFDLAETLDLAIHIADALAEAHSHSIIHRDIKPSNIIINNRGQAKILDFGLAKKIAAQSEDETQHFISQAGMILGTAAYMSPEQARGLAVDTRTDVWSFGVVLYEMLAGKPPFRGATTTDLLAAILKNEPENLRPINNEIPFEFERIVFKSLAKEREARYRSAKDLLADLKNLKADLDFHSKLAQSGSAVGGQMSQAVDKPKAKQTWWLSALLVLILLAGAVFAYRYFAANHKQIESIAVMPFVIESDNAEAEYLADGMTETLINSLSELPNVNVKARSSVFRYKGKQINAPTIAKELNVQAILTGSVMQRGEQLILNLELIDAQTENVIWSEQYNHPQSDLINLQNEIARDVSGKIKIKLSGADEAKVTKNYTTSSEAFQLYLKGRFYWNKRTGDDLKKAIEQFKAAADKDSNFALAYVGLADSYALLQQYTEILPSESMPQAKAYAEHALQIDDSLAEAHTSMGFIHYNLWQWAESEKEFKRAIELNPNYPTAHHWYYIYLRDMRRFDEALAEIKRAQELEPLSLVINLSLTRAYLLTGDLDSFIRETQRTMELYPNYAPNYSYLGLAYVKQGRYEDALTEMRKGVELERSSSALAFLGYTDALSGNQSEAKAILKELEEKYAKHEARGVDIAQVYTGLGKKDEALEWLERDFQTRIGDLSAINWLPTLDPLRREPRFIDLLRRMGIETR